MTTDDRIPIPLEVATSSGYWRRIVALYVLLGAVAALLVLSALRDLRSPWGSTGKAAMLFALAAIPLAIPTFLVVGRRYGVARFDAAGVTLRNGRAFDWTSLDRVVARTRRYRVTHYELVFRNGTARVFHQMAANRAEVERALDALTRGVNPFRG